MISLLQRLGSGCILPPLQGKCHLVFTQDLPNPSPTDCVPCRCGTAGSAQKPTFCLATGNKGGMEGRNRGEGVASGSVLCPIISVL